MARNWPTNFPGVNWFDNKEERAVLDVIRKRALFRYYGPQEPSHVASFETLAREFYGSKYSLGVSGGTGALTTAMIALGIGPGDEVIVPAFFWVSTVGAVVLANAIPVLCEVDDSFTMDPVDLQKKITRRTKLIVVVHMAGVPANMARIMAIARQHKIDVMEDCAQCNGGSFKGRKVGTFGRVGMFSFQINKNATSGEGGLLVTDDQDTFLRLDATHDVGTPWRGRVATAVTGPFLWGQGRRMGELAGAVANVQLRKLPRIVEHMRESNHRIQAALKGIPALGLRRLNDPAGDTGAALVLLLPDADKAKAVVQRFVAPVHGTRLADFGMHIYSSVPQLTNKVPLSPSGNPWSLPQNVSIVRDYAKGACPQSDALFERSIIIPIPSRLSRSQEKAVVAGIRKAVTG